MKSESENDRVYNTDKLIKAVKNLKLDGLDLFSSITDHQHHKKHNTILHTNKYRSYKSN